jgi:chaperonin GroEL
VKAIDSVIHSLSGDEKIGAQIVRKSIEEPLRTLCANAGVEGSHIVQEVLLKHKGAHGYNVATAEYEDLVAGGVVDPTKVTRMAIINASSVAGLLLTTECIITDLPEESKPAAGGDHMDH